MIIKIPGLSKAATMEAKANYLADAAARQAALNSQIVQTCECSLLPNKSVKTLFYSSTGELQRKRGHGNKRGKFCPKEIWLEPNQKPILPMGV